MSIKKLLGKRIKELRTQRGWTQEKFAEYINITLRQLARIEAGESLTSDNLNEIYYELVKKYFGESTIIDDLINLVY